MDIESIYKSLDEMALKHLMLNDEAMVRTQSMGYNGLKRLHRVNSKKFHCDHIKLENDMFERYRKVLNVTPQSLAYSPTNIRTHLMKWKEVLEADIKELGSLNDNHIKIVGFSNKAADSMIDKFLHDYEKVSRWVARFNESNWNVMDIHMVDDRLHDKMKEIESK